MGKGDPPKDTTGEVPLWFMTYSDVVTLLMTFFILLLTFASSEPEQFEKMQITMFGPGGATGFADPMKKGLPQDSFAARIRPKSSRISMEGSEMPPKQEVSKESVDGELAGLEEDKTRDIVDEYQVIVPLAEFTSTQGELYPYAKQHLSMLARQLQSMPFEAVFEVSQEANIDRAIACTHYIFQERDVPPGKSAVSWDPLSRATADQMLIIVRQHRRN
jgi:flagellar motor protein MotB